MNNKLKQLNIFLGGNNILWQFTKYFIKMTEQK